MAGDVVWTVSANTVVVSAGALASSLILQRSSLDKPVDRIPLYFPPAIGCALANQLGNNGYVAAAIAICVAVLAYIYWVLKPFPVR